MTRVFRDTAILESKLAAKVKAAGAAGISMTEALQFIAAGDEPQGADYMIAKRLRTAGLIEAIKNLPKGGMTLYWKDGNGAEKMNDTPAKEKAAPVKRRRRRHKHHDTTVLLTIQYGRSESITLSFDQARQVYEHLAAMFGGAD